VRIEGPFKRNRREGFAEPPEGVRVSAFRAPAEETGRAPGALFRGLITRAYRRPASTADVDLLMKFYGRPAGKTNGFDEGIEMVLGPRAWAVAKVHLPASKTEPASGES